MNKEYHFRVNLGGMLDILSNHLYKSPDVFLRELLQNGVDAITMRQKKQPSFNEGRIVISVEKGKKLIFRDNGAGLSEKGIHRFLSVIGQSSKNELVNGKLPEDYIGRFGIGLLSCFMVSDCIEVHTKPVNGGKGHVWKGMEDGTYTLEPLEECKEGTAIILTAKAGAEGYFDKRKIEELVRYYGLALSVPIYIEGNSERINRIPRDFQSFNRSQLLGLGNWLFDEEFLDAIPICTKHLNGVAYVLSYETSIARKNEHRIYLKQMLLTEKGDTLIPSWAFFLKCFLNTGGLRPTASREDFYEDEELEEARKEFADAIKQYLANLSENEPERLQHIVGTHLQAIKAMAVWDDMMFKLFIDYLPFETSEGKLTGAALKQIQEGAWISSTSKFNQLKPIFMAQGKILICTGYTSDEELVSKLSRIYHLPISPLQEENIDLAMEELTFRESRQAYNLLQAADYALKSFDCQAKLRHFLPEDLPALYYMSADVEFLRQLQSVREERHSIFSGALSSLLESVEERPLATLYLNLNSPLIKKLINCNKNSVLESMVKVLYIQALLAGGHSLKGQEMKILNNELLNLVDYVGDENKE